MPWKENFLGKKAGSSPLPARVWALSVFVPVAQGNLPLEKSLKVYEEGVSLTAYCEKALAEARLKITQLQPEQPKEDPADE